MNLMELVHEECCLAQAAFPDKGALLQAVASAARKAPSLAALSEEYILKGLAEREEVGSTGFGGGIAIPHCRLPGVTEFVVGIVAIPDGVPFAALDDQPVRLAIFIVAPEDGAHEQIRLLSCISRVLSTPSHVEELVAGATPESLRESFLRHAVIHLDTEGGEGKNLFHIFIQNEDLFREVLQVFSGIPQCNMLILEAENESAYLSKLPMFAGFWSDKPSSFARLLVALVNKNVTNETLRQIEVVTGPLQKADGVLVAVQEVYFAAGSLRF